jgi:hypothetical protein
MWFLKSKRGRELFRSYELAVLDAVRVALSPPATELFDQQIAGKELVQRMFRDTEVNTYPNRRGPQHHDPAIAFRNRSPELRLATVRLRGPSGTGKAVVYAVGGHVFSLLFKPSPRDLGSRDEIAAVDTTLHVDPMLADDGTALRQRLADLEPTLREELQRIWADRPSWAASVGAPEDLYTIDLEDGTLLVIAQLEDTTYVVAGVDPPRPGVHRYEAEGDLIGEYATVREAVVAEP